MIVRVTYMGDFTYREIPFICSAKDAMSIRCCKCDTFNLEAEKLICSECGSVYGLHPKFIFHGTSS